MADVRKSSFPFTIDGANQYIMGGDSTGQVSILVLHILSNTATGSMVVKGRKRGTAFAFVTLPYKSRFLNNAASTDGNLTTAITNTSIVEIDAAGLDISLDVSALSANTFTVEGEWLIG